MPPKPRNDYERKLIDIVRGQGWQVTFVFDPEGFKPNFSYSIGIFETLKAPEMIVAGLPKESAADIINLYGQKIREASGMFRAGEFVDGLIDGYDAFLIDVTLSPKKQEFAKSASWYYNGKDFPMVQLVWPSSAGNWPWQTGQEALLRDQPLLASPTFIQ